MRAWTRAAILIAGLLPTGAPAQQPPDAAHVLEWSVRERWLHGRQQAAFTPWSTTRNFVIVDSVASGPEERGWFLSLARPGSGSGGVIWQDGAARITGVEAWLSPIPENFSSLREERARWRRHFLGSGGSDYLHLPAARLWDLVPSFHPDTLAAGAAWADTLRRFAQEGPLVQGLGGVRISTLVADTVVAGRVAWWVSHVAEVAYEETYPVAAYTLAEAPVQGRAARGTLSGRYLYDPSSGLALVRTDTLRLEGEAVIVYADGRAYTTPAGYERILQLRHHSPTEYVALRAAEAARARAERGGMVRIPDDLDRRLAAGESAAVDSLVAEMARATGPERRQELLRLLRGAQGPGAHAAIRSALLPDTLALLTFRDPRNRVTQDRLDLLLPFLRDPGLAFDFGLDPDAAFQGLDLLNQPPAFEPDSARWPCVPAACERLVRLYEESDPRLRDVGLAAGLALAPAAFAPLVLEAQPTATPLLERAVQLVHGVAATWPAATGRPLPDGRAPWPAWSEWMTGRDPGAPMDSAAGEAPRRAPEVVRFAPAHLHAIRFHEAATGRNVAAELQPRFDAAEGDTAHLVFGTILHGLGVFRPGPQALARMLIEGDEGSRQLALRSLPSPGQGAFWRPFAAAEAGEEAELAATFLAIAAGRAEPWPPLLGLDIRVDLAENRHEPPAFVLADSLPPHLRAVLAVELAPLTQAQWDARDPTQRAVLYRLDPVVRAGPFAVLRLNWTAYLQREPGQAPRAYMGGHTVTLLRVENGWHVVAVVAWIT